MSKQRPVHLDLSKIKFPSTAIISILHRISGVLLFLLLPCILLAFHYSLLSQDGFNIVHSVLHNSVAKVVLWILLISIVHHFFAGIRHLLMDLGFGESMCKAKATSWLVFLIDIILFVLIGVWLWV